MSWILVPSGTTFLWKRKALLYVLILGTLGNKILVKKKDHPVCHIILVLSGTKFWWKWKTVLYVLNFGALRNKILVKKKGSPVCPEFWYPREQNSGEKERPSFMSLNFGTLWNKILVKKKDLPVSPLILAPYGTKFWWKKKDPPVRPWISVTNGTKFVKKKDASVHPWILVPFGTKFWWKRKTLLYVPEFWYPMEQNSGEKERPSCMSLNFGTLWNKILVKKNTLFFLSNLLQGCCKRRGWGRPLIPVFDRSVNPISTRGAHHPHPVLTSPDGFSNFETALCYHS